MNQHLYFLLENAQDDLTIKSLYFAFILPARLLYCHRKDQLRQFQTSDLLHLQRLEATLGLKSCFKEKHKPSSRGLQQIRSLEQIIRAIFLLYADKDLWEAIPESQLYFPPFSAQLSFVTLADAIRKVPLPPSSF